MVHGLCVYCPWCGQEEDGLRLAASLASPSKPPAASHTFTVWRLGSSLPPRLFYLAQEDSRLSQCSAPAPFHISCWEPSASPHEEV